MIQDTSCEQLEHDSNIINLSKNSLQGHMLEENTRLNTKHYTTITATRSRTQ
jgi:hypothetical protein